VTETTWCDSGSVTCHDWM